MLKESESSGIKTEGDKEKGVERVPNDIDDHSKTRTSPHKFEPPNIADTIVARAYATFRKQPTSEDPT